MAMKSNNLTSRRCKGAVKDAWAVFPTKVKVLSSDRVLRRERVKLEAEGTERLKDGSTFDGYFSSCFFSASEGTVGLACQNRTVRWKRVAVDFSF